MPALTTFGVTGHQFNSRDSDVMNQDGFGKKRLKPIGWGYYGPTLKYVAGHGPEQQEIFAKYRTKRVDRLHETLKRDSYLYHDLRGHGNGVHLAKYGTSLCESNNRHRRLPQTWIGEQHRKVRPNSPPPTRCRSAALVKAETRKRDDLRDWKMMKPSAVIVF